MLVKGTWQNLNYILLNFNFLLKVWTGRENIKNQLINVQEFTTL